MYKMLTTKENDLTCVSDTKHVVSITSDVIIKEFELDTWEVKSAPNHDTHGAVIEKSNHLFINRLQPIPEGRGYDSLTQNKIVHPYVNPSYEVVQFSQGAKWFDYFTQEGLLTIESSLVMDTTHFGITCDIGEEAVIKGEDKVKRYFILALGHGKSVPRMLGFTDIRPICCNTLTAAAHQGLKTHATSFAIDTDPSLAVIHAKRLVALIKHRFQSYELPAYRHMTNIKVTTDERDLLWRQLLGMPLEGWDVSEKLSNNYTRLEEIYKKSPGMELFDDSENNGWRILQAVTYAAPKLGAGDVWSQYRTRFNHTWVNKTHEWLRLRFDKDVPQVGAKMSKSEVKEIVASVV